MGAVLFVDDDEDLREVMEDILHASGVRDVMTAGSLAELQNRRDEALGCQLAILDINLGTNEPGGVSVYEWLMREGFAGQILFLTGHATTDPRVQAAARVAGSVVASKPLTLGELRELIGQRRDAS